MHDKESVAYRKYKRISLVNILSSSDSGEQLMPAQGSGSSHIQRSFSPRDNIIELGSSPSLNVGFCDPGCTSAVIKIGKSKKLIQSL
jgi:hypothetical protein